MGRLMPFAVGRAWASWVLWTGGVTLRWLANVNEWHWRTLLPVTEAVLNQPGTVVALTKKQQAPRRLDL